MVDQTDSNIPILHITATNDGICTTKLIEEMKTPLPADYKHVIIKGGSNHGNFGSYGEQPHDKPADISVEEQQDITVKVIVDWIEERQKD